MPGGASVEQDRRALEALIVGNHELDQLEALVNQFNIFESIGVTRQELRHSDFLGFLLDPGQNHGLDDVFVRRLLQNILVKASHLNPSISPIHVDSWDLRQLKVRREWRYIDLLLVDEANKVVVLIENKVGTGEHSGQLATYLAVVRREYPGPEWQHLAIFLTPEGIAPSEAAYQPASYGTVAEVVEAVAHARRDRLDPAAYHLMLHYAGMLRRHVVVDSQIADLCRRIYARHQRAIDLIIEHRPDRQANLQALLIDLMQSEPGLIPDYHRKGGIRFSALAWDGLPIDSSWTRSGRILLFQFNLSETILDLNLWVGPGPDELRDRLIRAGIDAGVPFTKGREERGGYQSIYHRSFLSTEDLLNMSDETLVEHVSSQWKRFVGTELPVMTEAMRPEKLGYSTLSVGSEGAHEAGA